MKNLIVFALWIMGMIQCHGQAPKGRADYFTEYGVLSLQFNGNKVSGAYPHSNGKITGILKDSLLTGTWSQSDGGGALQVRFNPDFSKFKIHYNHSNTKDSTGTIWKTDWSGMRAPEAYSQVYRTTFGDVTFRFQGTQVEGTYEHFNGKIMGELANNVLTGVWLQSNRGFGALKFTFSKDLLSFKGTYNDYNYKPEKWAKWNGSRK